MKVKIEVDATPEEFRRFLGMPDVTELQQELMTKFRENIEAGMEGYDPMRLMAPMLPENLRTLEAMQRAFWSAASNEDDEKD